MTIRVGTIETRGVWHRATLRVLKNATSTYREVTVRWRTVVVRCCGQQWGRADETAPPVWVEGDRGELGDLSVQCGNCGSRHSLWRGREVA